jgi:hypothetical protein
MDCLPCEMSLAPSLELLPEDVRDERELARAVIEQIRGERAEGKSSDFQRE